MIEFQSWDKDPGKAEEKSWAASCDQITRWKGSGTRDIEVWIKRGDTKEFRVSSPVRANTTEEQNDIIQTINAACNGKPPKGQEMTR